MGYTSMPAPAVASGSVVDSEMPSVALGGVASPAPPCVVQALPETTSTTTAREICVDDDQDLIGEMPEELGLEALIVSALPEPPIVHVQELIASPESSSVPCAIVGECENSNAVELNSPAPHVLLAPPHMPSLDLATVHAPSTTEELQQPDDMQHLPQNHRQRHCAVVSS